MIVLQLLLYCLLFTAMVKIAVIGGAVNGLYFYPKEVQDRAIELGLIDRNTMNRKRKCFMNTVLYRDACCSCADHRFVERGLPPLVRPIGRRCCFLRS